MRVAHHFEIRRFRSTILAFLVVALTHSILGSTAAVAATGTITLPSTTTVTISAWKSNPGAVYHHRVFVASPTTREVCNPCTSQLQATSMTLGGGTELVIGVDVAETGQRLLSNVHGDVTQTSPTSWIIKFEDGGGSPPDITVAVDPMALQRLRLLTWNIQGKYVCTKVIDLILGCGVLLRDIAAEIQRSRATVVALTEVQESQAKQIADMLGWPTPNWLEEHDPAGPVGYRPEGLAILSSEPQYDKKGWRFPAPFSGNPTHGFARSIVYQDGVPVHVYVAHLDSTGGHPERVETAESNRAQQVEYILQQVARDRAAAVTANEAFLPVVAGDMNAAPSESRSIGAFKNAGFADSFLGGLTTFSRKCDKKALIACGYTNSSRTVEQKKNGVKFKPNNPTKRIDYILVNVADGFDVESVRSPYPGKHPESPAQSVYPDDVGFSHYQNLSDHVPVIGSLWIPAYMRPLRPPVEVR